MASKKSVKKILLLGAGLVAKPLIEYLSAKDYIFLTIASRSPKGIEDTDNRKFVVLNITTDHAKLEKLVQEHDLVISLLPYIYHVQVAKLCLKHNSHLVTTSYVSPQMAELDEEAKEKKLVFLNEIGLDPGIDHMSAMQLMDSYKKEGWEVEAFYSYCGGLPARADNNNPLGYKFSWSPRGVLLAGNNSAQFLEDGDIIFIPSSKLFKTNYYLDIQGVGTLEVYPNRDSLPYQKIYKLDGARSVFRGTLRNPGWCSFMQKIKELGYLDPTPREDLKDITYGDLTADLVGCEDVYELKKDTAHYLGIPMNGDVILKMDWLGLFDFHKFIPEGGRVSALDALGVLLQEKISLLPGEKDWVIMVHNVVLRKGDIIKEIQSVFSMEGEEEGYSAMSRTVSIPAAIASDLIVQGKIKSYGVKIPVEKKIYKPILEELSNYGIKFKEYASERQIEEIELDVNDILI
jgi:saccharopine dehydrogenase-like NADP-dependent oxidoreductase